MTVPDASAELQAAVVDVKREMGVDTVTAEDVAGRLPECLRREFWRQAVDRYLAEQATGNIEPEGSPDA